MKPGAGNADEDVLVAHCVIVQKKHALSWFLCWNSYVIFDIKLTADQCIIRKQGCWLYNSAHTHTHRHKHSNTHKKTCAHARAHACNASESAVRIYAKILFVFSWGHAGQKKSLLDEHEEKYGHQSHIKKLCFLKTIYPCSLNCCLLNYHDLRVNLKVFYDAQYIQLVSVELTWLLHILCKQCFYVQSILSAQVVLMALSSNALACFFLWILK